MQRSPHCNRALLRLQQSEANTVVQKHLASIKWIYPEGCYSQPPSLTRRDHFIKIACPKTAVRSSLQGRDDSTLMKDAVRITKACGSYIAVVSSAAAVAVRSSLQK